MENVTRSALTNASGQIVQALNNTSTQFASHPSAVSASGPRSNQLTKKCIHYEDNVRAKRVSLDVFNDPTTALSNFKSDY